MKAKLPTIAAISAFWQGVWHLEHVESENRMNTTTKPTNITQLSTVRCGANHSGNHTLHRLTRGSWQCAGCGAMYTDAQVAAPGAGVIGSGGVIKSEK